MTQCQIVLEVMVADAGYINSST